MTLASVTDVLIMTLKLFERCYLSAFTSMSASASHTQNEYDWLLSTV